MSRVLADLLGTNEPSFHIRLRQLEQAAGRPSADIRLATGVTQATRQKIRELGLDPSDTTGHELYAALQMRLKRDEMLVRSALNLRADIDPVDILQQVTKKLNTLESKGDQFVIKQTVIKQIIKKLKPKATMKRLGYRSMDSMLKHESVAQLLAACQVTESSDWHVARLKAYEKLQTKDFEHKKPQSVVPTGKKWPELAQAHAAVYKNNIIEVPELGAVVILPLEQDLPGLAITTFVVALQALNSMKALSAYLKLQQVRPDFGMVVSESIAHEPLTDVELGGVKLSWHALHWFYGHGHADYYPEVFEPHVQPDDLAWHKVGDSLERLHPVLGFWQETDSLGLLDGKDAVSLNILDVALGLCNNFDYAERTLHHMRETLGRELLARYLHQDNLQAMLSTSLGRQLTPDVEFDA